jgi:hypothetical protein
MKKRLLSTILAGVFMLSTIPIATAESEPLMTLYRDIPVGAPSPLDGVPWLSDTLGWDMPHFPYRATFNGAPIGQPTYVGEGTYEDWANEEDNLWEGVTFFGDPELWHITRIGRVMYEDWNDHSIMRYNETFHTSWGSFNIWQSQGMVDVSLRILWCTPDELIDGLIADLEEAIGLPVQPSLVLPSNHTIWFGAEERAEFERNGRTIEGALSSMLFGSATTTLLSYGYMTVSERGVTTIWLFCRSLYIAVMPNGTDRVNICGSRITEERLEELLADGILPQEFKLEVINPAICCEECRKDLYSIWDDEEWMERVRENRRLITEQIENEIREREERERAEAEAQLNNECDLPVTTVALGHVRGETTMSARDAIEILRFAIDLPSILDTCPDAFAAALIVSEDEPGVADAIAILRNLVGLPSALDRE